MRAPTWLVTALFDRFPLANEDELSIRVSPLPLVPRAPTTASDFVGICLICQAMERTETTLFCLEVKTAELGASQSV